MAFLNAIIEFIKSLFNMKDDRMPTDLKFKVGDRVELDGYGTGTITEVNLTLDPRSPYIIKFDGVDYEEGTFSDAELLAAP